MSKTRIVSDVLKSTPSNLWPPIIAGSFHRHHCRRRCCCYSLSSVCVLKLCSSFIHFAFFHRPIRLWLHSCTDIAPIDAWMQKHNESLLFLLLFFFHTRIGYSLDSVCWQIHLIRFFLFGLYWFIFFFLVFGISHPLCIFIGLA